MPEALCVALGRTNAGKTVFTLRFAAYLGVKRLRLAFAEADGRLYQREYGVEEALRDLAGPTPHLTRRLQRISLEIPGGKGVKRFDLVDTSGLMDGIHPDREVRRAMAQTLAVVRDARVILHLVDAAMAGQAGPVAALGDVDYQVAQFAQMRGGYAILANKMDLPGAQKGLEIIRKEFPGHTILPISALHSQGFQEVRRFVWNQL